MTKQRLRDFLDSMGRADKEIRKSAPQLKNDLREVEPQKEISTEDETPIVRNGSCRYSQGCDMPTCKGCLSICRNLK